MGIKLTPVVEECHDSPEAKQEFFSPSQTTGRLHFIAKHYDSWDSAYYAVKDAAPEYYGSGNLTIKTISVKPIPGTDCWDAIVDYGFNKKDIDIYLQYRGSTTGGTKHISHSLRTAATMSAYADLPDIDFGGAIGVNDKGDIEGVDIKCPNFTWSIRKKFEPEVFTQARRAYFARLTASINSEPFWGFDRYEVMFDGIDWELVIKQFDEANALDYYYLVTFQFSVNRNERGVKVGNLIFNKPGWYYAWVYYGSQTDGKTVNKYARNVCVEQVYQEYDFNNFELGEL